MKYAILLKKEKIKDEHGYMHVYNTWYHSAGKYSNTFSTGSHLEGARIFTTIKKAQEALNSEKFQYRLKVANELRRRIKLKPYEPTIIEIIN